MLHTLGVTKKNGVIARSSREVLLDDGLKTMLHIVCYEKKRWRPRIVTFDAPTLLGEWCRQNKINEALVGGFFITGTHYLLGEHWVNGTRLPSIDIPSRWSLKRGCLHIDEENNLMLGARQLFPAKPRHLMHAGPMLVEKNVVKVQPGNDNEGFSAGSSQFDSDISLGRYPRAAIGCDDEHYWSVVCDGRSKEDAGLSLIELAEVMIGLGAKYALNLDGGASTTQISGGELRNNPRGVAQDFPTGRPLLSAITFTN